MRIMTMSPAEVPLARSPSAPRVAVCGCGPAAMFFLHAVETRRRLLLAEGDDGQAARLPTVTCFEKAGAPGGVWRAQRAFRSHEEEKKCEGVCGARRSHEAEEEEEEAATSPDMYEALWTNGPKEAMEFFDYTFEDHFGVGVKLPTYLPRRAVLDYMMARVTRDCPDLFETSCRFHTELLKVAYDEGKREFSITIRDLVTGNVSTESYDKCICAGGTNGVPVIPAQLQKVFASFAGRAIHSSQVASQLKKDVAGKKILLIGGNYSAEDLALMAIKLDAVHVYIATRHADYDEAVLWQEEWPFGKVTILIEQVVARVLEDRRSIELVRFNVLHDTATTEVTRVLRDVETVIYCTGYEAYWGMLDPSFCCLPPDEFDTYWNEEDRIQLPEDWTMPLNALSDRLGDIPVAPDTYPGYYANPYEYRQTVCLTNPNMIYLDGGDFSPHLLAVDVQAYYALAVIMGERPLPDADQMRRETYQEAMHELSMPQYRFYLDRNYRDAVRALPGYENGKFPSGWVECCEEASRYSHCRLARLMEEGGYPVSIGSFTELNEKGRMLLEMSEHGRNYYADGDEGLTYRDIGPQHCRYLRSLHTGVESVPFKGRWVDLNHQDDPSCLV